MTARMAAPNEQSVRQRMTRVRAEITSLIASRPDSIRTLAEAQVAFRRLEALDEAVRNLWKVET